jgi:hypothetical protein
MPKKPENIKHYSYKDIPPIMKRLIKFEPQEGVKYRFPYADIMLDETIRQGAEAYLRDRKSCTYENNAYLAAIRKIIKDGDIFFIVNFVAGNPIANDPKGFVVRMSAHTELDMRRFYKKECHNFLTIEARGHFKTSTRTEASSVIHILNHQDDAILLLAAVKKLAKGYLRGIRLMFQMREMIDAFSDVLYDYVDGKSASPCWTADELALKRTTARREYSIETAGLLDGMPVGRHYNIITSDDIETQDLVDNPDMIKKLKSRYKMAKYLCTDYTMYNVVGTYYHHQALLAELTHKKLPNGVLLYKFNKVPAIDKEGVPVFLTKEQIEEKKAEGLDHFYTQYMCDPTPRQLSEFNSSMLKEVEPKDIPKGLFKIMIIDPASGSPDAQDADSFSVGVLGIDRNHDEVGACDIYITNLSLRPMTIQEAEDEIINMYIAAGTCQALCIEQSNDYALSYHVKKELTARKGITWIDGHNFIGMKSQSRRDKKEFIKRTLARPFQKGKIHISKSVSYMDRANFKQEMDNFPLGHDDGLDMTSWVYRILDELNFEYMVDYYADTNVIDFNTCQNSLRSSAAGFFAT